ncbi:MAG: YdcF family protein [Oligoflexia bacterium]|nr:YdcF family protein [Oligoflexia bacterium]
MNQQANTINTGSQGPTSQKRLLLWLGLGVFCIMAVVGSWGLLKNHGYRLIEAGQPATSALVADCGVVLTGGPGRVREGISLLSQKQVKKLIVSGAYQGTKLSDIFPEILFYPEIRLEDVVLERRSNSTAANAQLSLPLVETLRCRSILLITSDFHMLRALRTFQSVFPAQIEIIPYALASDRLRKRPGKAISWRFWTTTLEEGIKYLLYEVTVF